MGITQGLNVYCYSGNDPIGRCDPMGLWGWPSWKTVAKVAAVVAVGIAVTAAVVVAAPFVIGAAAAASVVGAAAVTITAGAAGMAAAFGLNEALNQEVFCAKCILMAAGKGFIIGGLTAAAFLALPATAGVAAFAAMGAATGLGGYALDHAMTPGHKWDWNEALWATGIGAVTAGAGRRIFGPKPAAPPRQQPAPKPVTPKPAPKTVPKPAAPKPKPKPAKTGGAKKPAPKTTPKLPKPKKPAVIPSRTKPTGKPTGPRATQKKPRKPGEPRNPGQITRGHELEDASADILAKAGYKVEQNPVLTAEQRAAQGIKPGKDPDYLIEGNVFDGYSPSSNKLDSVIKGTKKKIDDQQTQRVVLNLADSPDVRITDIQQAARNGEIPGLKELIIIDKYGVIHRTYP
jgi:hypothetical protein